MQIQYIQTIAHLLKTDLYLYKKTVISTMVDLSIWVVTMVVVTAFLMPSFGLQPGYTGFMVASLVASAGLFELYASVTRLISDFEGNNITSFYLILPIPSWMVFIRNILFYAISCASMSLLVLPLSKLSLWSHLDLSELSIIKFAIMIVLNSILFATLTLWTASYVPDLTRIGSVWMRFIYPLWFLGGFQFSFVVLKSLSPALAYVSLANPMMYAMEGTRGAILGQQGSLNFWVCVGMLVIFICFFGWRGISRLKKRLDFI